MNTGSTYGEREAFLLCLSRTESKDIGKRTGLGKTNRDFPALSVNAMQSLWEVVTWLVLN